VKNNPTLIVTGATGFVAGYVLAEAAMAWDVHAITREVPVKAISNATWHSCKNADESVTMVRKLHPNAIIHTAAIADIDFAEKNRELATEINVNLTKALTEVCAEIGCKLVFCSTDTIFDGEHAPYNEQSKPGPVNFYAKTKVEAERWVAALGSQAVIARLALVVGFPVFGLGNSFLARTMAALKEGREIIAPVHEIRSPGDVITAARVLVELAAGTHHGIFHVAGHTRINRFEMMKMIANKFGFPSTKIIAQPPGSTPGRAIRPRDVSLDNGKVSAQLKTPMRTLDEALSIIIAEST
jgi:dTDP-4-dehydrorhamnose reductase